MRPLPFEMPPEPPRPSATEDNLAVIQRWHDWASLSLQLESLRLRQELADRAPSSGAAGVSQELLVLLQVFAAHLHGDPTPDMERAITQTRDIIAKAEAMGAAAA